jgi:hypothetical protein
MSDDKFTDEENDWLNAHGGDFVPTSKMIREEIHNVICRYCKEGEGTVYQIIGALRIVEHDLIEMLEGKQR